MCGLFVLNLTDSGFEPDQRGEKSYELAALFKALPGGTWGPSRQGVPPTLQGASKVSIEEDDQRP